MLADPVAAVAENLVEAMTFFGRARGAGEVERREHVRLIYSGLNYAAFNAAVLTRPFAGDEQEFARVIEAAMDFFSARGVRWTFWFCEDWLTGVVRREAAKLFKKFRMQALTEAPGMYSSAPVLADELPAVRVCRVDSAELRKSFAKITSATFDIPLATCIAIYGEERAWKGEFRGYVGMVRDEPVTTTAVMMRKDAVGLYSVATLDRFRRRGYARSTMQTVLEQVRAETGVQASVLQATRSGLRMYELLGYRPVTKFRVFISW